MYETLQPSSMRRDLCNHSWCLMYAPLLNLRLGTSLVPYLCHFLNCLQLYRYGRWVAMLLGVHMHSGGVLSPSQQHAAGVSFHPSVTTTRCWCIISQAGELEAWRDAPLAIMCNTGTMSAQACVRMSKVYGFAQPINVQGGMLAWQFAGLPTVTGA